MSINTIIFNRRVFLCLVYVPNFLSRAFLFPRVHAHVFPSTFLSPISAPWISGLEQYRSLFITSSFRNMMKALSLPCLKVMLSLKSFSGKPRVSPCFYNRLVSSALPCILCLLFSPSLAPPPLSPFSVSMPVSFALPSLPVPS